MRTCRHRLLSFSLAIKVDGSENDHKASQTLSSPDNASVLSLIEQGRYLPALRHCLLHILGHESQESTIEDFDHFEKKTQTILFSLLSSPERGNGSEAQLQDIEAKVEALLLSAIASLCVFVQANLTGPALKAPQNPFELVSAEWKDPASVDVDGNSRSDAGSRLGIDSTSLMDRWAGSQLAENGEDIIGKISYPQYLWLSVDVLFRIPAMLGCFDGKGNAGQLALTKFPPEWNWWALRSVLLQQRVLASRSAVLRERLLSLRSRLLHVYAPSLNTSHMEASIGTDMQRNTRPNALLASLFLELSMMETAYGDIKAAKEFTNLSASLLQFRAELTGALGIRTMHQQDPRPQLLLRIKDDYEYDCSRTMKETELSNALDARNGGNDDSTAAQHVAKEHWVESDGLEASSLDSALLEGAGMDEDVKGLSMGSSDVLPHPKILSTDSTNEEALLDGKHVKLTNLQQAVVLAMALEVKKKGAPDELQPWEMIAYTDSVLQQPRSEFLIRATARLFVSRAERSRSRTRERALLTLEGLAAALEEPKNIQVHDRIRCAFSVWFPLRVSLRKELGEAFVALGLVGAALPLFESLELWDNLILCYRLLEKKVAAEELVRRRLEVTPDDPRLWCALGDLNSDDTYYEEAWERSNHRSARAQRSLARSANRRSEFDVCAQHWEMALQLNPLYAEGWFSLGWAYMKTKDYTKAMSALTRAAQMDAENGEAWNNLAAVHMHLEHWPEAFVALNEAVKYKRESWQTWENFAMAAAHVGEWQAVVRGLSHALTLSRGERMQPGILAAVVSHVDDVYPLILKADACQDEPGGQEDSRAFDHSVLDESDNGSDTDRRQCSTTSERETEQSFQMSKPSAGKTELTSLHVVDAKIFEENHPVHSEKVSPDSGLLAEANSAKFFVEAVKKLMKQIANTASGDSVFWEIYARFYRVIGESEASKECLMKRVRALQGKSWLEDESSFVAYSSACQDLCRAYIDSGNLRELGQARMLLRSAIKSAETAWGDQSSLHELKLLLEEVTSQSKT